MPIPGLYRLFMDRRLAEAWEMKIKSVGGVIFDQAGASDGDEACAIEGVVAAGLKFKA